jgi:hypothetical protein
VLLAAPGLAATPKTKPVKVTDTKGDNNALNDQGVGLPVPETATPVGFPGMDILSVTFETVFKGKVANDLKITLELEAAPFTQSAIYRVTGSLGGCDTIAIAYEKSPEGESAYIRSCDAAAAPLGFTDTPISAPKIDGAKMIFTIPYKMFEKSLPEVRAKLGAVFSNIGAHNRLVLVAVTVPQVDAVVSTSTFKFGS